MAAVQVVLNNLSLYGTDADGTRWMLVDDIDGWDTPDIRMSTIDPTAMDGGILGESQYGTRTLTLRGVAKTTSETNYWKARNKLAEATNLIYNSGIMTVDEVSYVKRVTVRRRDLKMKLRGPSLFEWAVSLICLDPVKYNNSETTTTFGTVTNNGNHITWPVVTLTSGLNAFVGLGNPGLPGTPSVQLSGMNSGDVIDLRNRTVKTSGGVDKYESVNQYSTSWWWLAPGSNALSIAGATASITYRDAWI